MLKNELKALQKKYTIKEFRLALKACSQVDSQAEKDIMEILSVIRPYIIRRQVSVLEIPIPSKTESIIKVEQT